MIYRWMKATCAIVHVPHGNQLLKHQIQSHVTQNYGFEFAHCYRHISKGEYPFLQRIAYKQAY